MKKLMINKFESDTPSIRKLFQDDEPVSPYDLEPDYFYGATPYISTEETPLTDLESSVSVYYELLFRGMDDIRARALIFAGYWEDAPDVRTLTTEQMYERIGEIKGMVFWALTGWGDKNGRAFFGGETYVFDTEILRTYGTPEDMEEDRTKSYRRGLDAYGNYVYVIYGTPDCTGEPIAIRYPTVPDHIGWAAFHYAFEYRN